MKVKDLARHKSLNGLSLWIWALTQRTLGKSCHRVISDALSPPAPISSSHFPAPRQHSGLRLGIGEVVSRLGEYGRLFPYPVLNSFFFEGCFHCSLFAFSRYRPSQSCTVLLTKEGGRASRATGRENATVWSATLSVLAQPLISFLTCFRSYYSVL